MKYEFLKFGTKQVHSFYFESIQEHKFCINVIKLNLKSFNFNQFAEKKELEASEKFTEIFILN